MKIEVTLSLLQDATIQTSWISCSMLLGKNFVPTTKLSVKLLQQEILWHIPYCVPTFTVTMLLMTNTAHVTRVIDFNFLLSLFLSSRQVSNTMIISTLWACLLTLTPKPVFPVACFLYLWCTHSTAYNGTERKSLFKTTLTSGHCQVLQTGIQADTSSSFTQLKVKLSLTVL